MANTLFLRLEGPLQSWGERARWSVRDSAPEPTKSGVVGLLACALGLNRDEDLHSLTRQVRIGVRCDRQGSLLVDYHTVTGGVLSAEGRIKKTASTKELETVISWRSYLCDASFLVAVQAAHQMIEHLANAIQNPYWPIYLGRKSCPPSRPVYAGVGEYSSLEEALSNQPVQLQAGRTITHLRGVIECAPMDANSVRRRDEIDSRSRRTFLPRYTRDVRLDVPIQVEEE